MLKFIGATVLGMLAASVIMMAFEFTNSIFFPLPQGLNINDVNAVRAFAASLPWTAFILVLLGWTFGSFAGGFVASRFFHAKTFHPALAVAVVLTIAGIVNNVMLGSPVIVTIFGLVIFVLGAYGGFVAHQRLRRTK
jgi:hypothetical protein